MNFPDDNINAPERELDPPRAETTDRPERAVGSAPQDEDITAHEEVRSEERESLVEDDSLSQPRAPSPISVRPPPPIPPTPLFLGSLSVSNSC